jgi:hypothetical protein
VVVVLERSVVELEAEVETGVALELGGAEWLVNVDSAMATMTLNLLN